MDKIAFLEILQKKLSCLPQSDIDKTVDYYSEMIDDRMEDGTSEEEAVASLGDIDGIVSQILADTPLPRIVGSSLRPRRALRAWEIVLLILGFPLWGPLLVTAGAVVLSVYGVIWAVIASLYAVDLSFAVCAAAGVFACAVLAADGNAGNAVFILGAALMCAGISLLLLPGFNRISKGLFGLSRRALLFVKSRFAGRERA